MRVGVLALQGGFAAHAAALEALGHEVRLLRVPADLEGVEGLVLPGGESTTMWRLLQSSGLMEPLASWRRGPVLATCAGCILLAAKVTGPSQASLGWLDLDVERNGYGRQLDSFEATADDDDLPLVFIRAPRITRVGAGVRVLARCDGEPVLVQRGSVLAATFHPELTEDRRVHALAFGSLDGAEAWGHGDHRGPCTARAATASSPTTTASARATARRRSSARRSTTSG